MIMLLPFGNILDGGEKEGVAVMIAIASALNQSSLAD